MASNMSNIHIQTSICDVIIQSREGKGRPFQDFLFLELWIKTLL